MAHLSSRGFWQLLRMPRAVTTITSFSNRTVTTTHAVPLLNAGVDLESPDVIYGSRSWRWLRPASPKESEMDDWNLYKSRLSSPWLTINADREITEDIWRQMIRHISNQMPCLKMVILPRKNEKWICHVDDMDISLKIYEKATPDIFDKLLDEFVNVSPWVCMVVKADQDEACLLPEEKKSKPYQYKLTFGFHHAFIDGYSGVLLVRYAIDSLNVLLAGKYTENQIQLCQAIKGDEITAKSVKLKEAFKNDPKWFILEKERLLSTLKSPLLNEAFPAPKVSNPKSEIITRIADTVLLSAFQKHCKSAEVSVTNGLAAIINTAMVEMVREAGILRDSYHLTLVTNVDLRRYMNIHPQTATGMLVGGMNQSMYPTKNVRKEFWEHARIVNNDAKTLLKTDGTFVESVIREMAVPKVDPHVIFNSSDNYSPQCDYTINNLLDITPFMYNPKKHKHAAITGGVQLNSIHNWTPMNFSINRFRGITQFSLTYGTNFISQETAEELMERIVLLIRDKSQIKQ